MIVEPRRISKFLSNVVQNGPVPEHIAFIMDGNRRYAKKHNMKTLMGHYCGVEALENVLEFCFEAGVRVITVYAFSIENFKRSQEEIDHLMIMMRHQLERHGAIGGIIRRYDLSMRLFGRWDMLNDSRREPLMNAVDKSRHSTGGVLNLCVAYTSRDEMTRAMRKTVEGCSSIPSSITSQWLTDNMDSADVPSPDLLIRTSGVTRMSDFLLWQCHQETDIQFLDRLWPEFKPWDLFLIITKWQRRKAVSEGGRSKRSWWKKTGYDPSSVHIQAVSILLIMMLIFVII